MCQCLGYLIGIPRLLERGGEDYEVIFDAVADWLIANMTHAKYRLRVNRPNRYICAQSRRQMFRRLHRTQQVIQQQMENACGEPIAATKVQIESDFEFKIYLSLDFATSCSPDNIRLILTHMMQIKLGLKEHETVWISPVTGLKYDFTEFRVVVKFVLLVFLSIYISIYIFIYTFIHIYIYTFIYTFVWRLISAFKRSGILKSERRKHIVSSSSIMIQVHSAMTGMK